jgi:hypothetical protein
VDERGGDKYHQSGVLALSRQCSTVMNDQSLANQLRSGKEQRRHHGAILLVLVFGEGRMVCVAKEAFPY